MIEIQASKIYSESKTTFKLKVGRLSTGKKEKLMMLTKQTFQIQEAYLPLKFTVNTAGEACVICE